MTGEQVLLLAIVVVVIILVAVGISRGATRRRGANEDAFGAGGVPHVAIGTSGIAKTALVPEGVVLAAGEQWTATTSAGIRIEEGRPIRVVGQDGLTLLVEPVPIGVPTATSPNPDS
jgi:membrane-bound ClpP family serine protease